MSFVMILSGLALRAREDPKLDATGKAALFRSIEGVITGDLVALQATLASLDSYVEERIQPQGDPKKYALWVEFRMHVRDAEKYFLSRVGVADGVH